MHKLCVSRSASMQISFQEAVYYSLPELWLRKCYPKIINVSTGIHVSTVRTYQNLQTSTKDRRVRLTQYRQFQSVVNQICLAIFSVFSYLGYKNKEENYSQPNVLAVKSNECLVKSSKILLQSLLMILTSENLNFCKVQRFLRYHILNRKQHSEIFVHYLLFMFFFSISR